MTDGILNFQNLTSIINLQSKNSIRILSFVTLLGL